MKELKNINNLLILLKTTNNSCQRKSLSEIKRKRSMDELLRHFFIFKTIPDPETLEIRTYLHELLNSLRNPPEIIENLIKSFIDAKSTVFPCEYITISGAYSGNLIISKKNLYFLAGKAQNFKNNINKTHEFGVPV